MKLFSIFSGNKKPSQNNNVIDAIAYTKEIPYIPSYHWVKPTKFTPATTDSPFDKIEFVIHNTLDAPVYETYKDIFIKDGWDITREVKFFGFTAENETHLANISTIKSERDIILTVFTQIKTVS